MPFRLNIELLGKSPSGTHDSCLQKDTSTRQDVPFKKKKTLQSGKLGFRVVASNISTDGGKSDNYKEINFGTRMSVCTHGESVAKQAGSPSQ